jgi:hypothetical protein
LIIPKVPCFLIAHGCIREVRVCTRGIAMRGGIVGGKGQRCGKPEYFLEQIKIIGENLPPPDEENIAFSAEKKSSLSYRCQRESRTR